MSQSNEHFENFFLFSIGAVFLVAGVLYGIFLFWPYFLFYVLPFILGSLLVGYLLRFATLPIPTSQSKGFLKYDYKNLAIIYPGLIVLVLVVFFVGSDRAVIIDKNTGVEQIRFEWAWAHNKFNEYRSSTYKNSPFNDLKAKANALELYDREVMGIIAWFCLFLGGPLIFFILGGRDAEDEEKSINAEVNRRTAEERQRVEEKNANLNNIIESRQEKLRKEVKGLEDQRDELLKENNLLKARLEFSSDGPWPPDGNNTGGVLDRDLF